MDDFTQILDVRSRRLNKLKIQESIKYNAYIKSIDMEKEIENSIDSFKRFVVSYEIKLISDIVDREIRLHDIDELNTKLKEMEEKSINLKNSYIKAKEDVKNAEFSLNKISAQRRHAETKLQKLTEIADHVAVENKRKADFENALAEEAVIDDMNSFYFSIKR